MEEENTKKIKILNPDDLTSINDFKIVDTAAGSEWSILLIKPLLEDLDQAIKEENEVETKEKEVTKKYNDKVNEYNSVKRDIKKKNMTLYSNEEEILKTTKNISKVENKFNDNKKINEKLLKLKAE